ncbi:MAG: porin [Planctomycetota bacterium]
MKTCKCLLLAGVLAAGAMPAAGRAEEPFLRSPGNALEAVGAAFYEPDPDAPPSPTPEPASAAPATLPDHAGMSAASDCAAGGCGDSGCGSAGCDEVACYGPAACGLTATDACNRNACGGCNQQACRWCRCGKLEDAWKLPEPYALKCRGVDIFGWVQGGMYSNTFGAPENGPLGLNANADGFNLHQAWIAAEKTVDTGGYGFDWGGRIDYVYGVDGPDTQAFGDESWDFGWDSSDRYGSAIPQIYVEVGVNEWKVKGGRFYTLIGYEVVPATGNFFYSHSYDFYFAEPFTHTGVLASRSLGENLTGSMGWVGGWDGGFENHNGASMFLGGVSWTPTEKASIAWYCSAGNFGDGRFSGNDGDLYMNSIVFTYQLTEKWTYVLQHDLGANYNIPGSEDTEWYGIVQYLLYTINDCWSFGGRIEWFRDDDGVRVLGDGEGRNFYEFTAGINWRPHSNVIIRPELRYDWTSDPNPASQPFNGGTRTDQFSGGFDAIFTF